MALPLNYTTAVRNLQRYLRLISFTDERIQRVPVDGIFADDTKKAVKSFQRTRGFEETGIVDRVLWDAIYAEYTEIEENTGRWEMINFFPAVPDGYEAKLGEKHAFVSVVQLLLSELVVVYDWGDEVSVNGVFDGNTERAVKHFQKASRLPETGRVDLRTWNRLSRDFKNYAAF